MDEGFGLNRFDLGAPGRPGGSIDARGRFFGAWLLSIKWWVLQKGWYQLAVASTYDVCGAVVGAQDLKQQLVREWLVFEV